jgi:hypothetical protein
VFSLGLIAATTDPLKSSAYNVVWRQHIHIPMYSAATTFFKSTNENMAMVLIFYVTYDKCKISPKKK